MASLYLVSVQVFAESPEDAVSKVIKSGVQGAAKVQDLANQVQYPPLIDIPIADEEVLPL